MIDLKAELAFYVGQLRQLIAQVENALNALFAQCHEVRPPVWCGTCAKVCRDPVHRKKGMRRGRVGWRLSPHEIREAASYGAAEPLQQIGRRVILLIG
ncbi:hypothetical protein DSM101010T_09690 [Desulfovibrio subterraneus]|uniref:Uncharacterized protein n=1 Tax=Desulfovibrio subterraneus TaxID=2718620 RepID=A0A7J0BHP1_9BACT|nr:hypothetical protein DSM101010T_09690 [Desulfovibrio subterraneus]